MSQTNLKNEHSISDKESMDNNNNKQGYTWKIVIGFGVVLGIIVSGLVIEDRIEKIVSDKLKDPEIIKQIASLVRPSLTFNHEGNILTDSGAGQFIKDIKVEMGKKEPRKITVYPKEHLNVNPALECTNYNFDISAKRINKSDWLYELSSPDYFTFGGSTKKWMFRLEIIR